MAPAGPSGLAAGVRQNGPRFLPFLPDDNNSLSNAASAQAIQLISDELGRLLALAAKDFWTVVLEDASLITCLDTFLRFRRRGFDRGQVHTQEESVMSEVLARQVFLVFMRLVTLSPPGSGAPSPSQQAELLYNKWILDVPKLMDLAVLYGPDNLAATQKLLVSLCKLQPAYLKDISNMVEPLVENLAEVHARCDELCARIAKGDLELTSNVLDAAGYLVDACVTLKVFAEVFPPAGRLLLGPNDTAPLIGILTNLHKRLLPAMLHAVKQPGALEALNLTEKQAGKKIELVGTGIEALIYQLICSAFMSTVTSPADAGLSLESRGEQLLTLLMSVAQPSAQGSTQHATDKPLLQQVNAHFGLDSAIVAAAQQGIIAVDEAQFDYLMALLGSTTTLSAPVQRAACADSSLSSATVARARDSSNATGSASSKPGAVELSSLVSQVKEVLPDFGDGFITACLEAYEYNSEQVIHHLLEGSLPSSLSSLDTQLAVWPPPDRTSAGDKGKGKATRSTDNPQGPSNALSWRGLAAQAAEAESSAAAAAEASTPASWNTGTTGARQVARSTLRALGGASSDVKNLTKQLGNNMQWDYEDEYDDSFDDLNVAGADGVADVEGDDTTDKGTGRAEVSDTGRGSGAAGPPSSSGAGRGGGRGGAVSGKKTRLWVLDGKVYNYKKEGAEMVESQEAAERAIDAANAAAEAIYGLGAGGNFPVQPVRAGADDGDAGEEGSRPGGPGAGPGPGRGGGRRGGGGGGAGGPSRGGGRGSFAHKDRNKAAIGNHHRKDRALRKMGL